MADLPFLYAQIDSRLRAEGIELCTRMERHLHGRGVRTSNWRFDAETELRLQTTATVGKPCAQPIVEFTLESGDERRKVQFIGPMFVWEPTLFTDVTPVGAMPTGMVREFFEKISDARDALAQVLQEPTAMGSGIVPWQAYGHRSNLTCLLTGVPHPRVLDVPIEDVLPTGCVIHLVDGGDGQAVEAATRAVEAVRRRGRLVVWFDNPRYATTAAVATGHQPRCVEEAVQTWMSLMGQPSPPALIVFRQPSLIPTAQDLENHVGASCAPAGPEAPVMWANVLPQILLRELTVIAFHSIDGIKGYPDEVPLDLQPWRTNAKYERIYRPGGIT